VTASANARSNAWTSDVAPSSRSELCAQVLAVERGGCVGLVRVHRLALHELALDRVKRRERVMACLERLYFRGDAEQTGEKILDVRCERNEKRRLVLHRQSVGRYARSREASRESRVGGLEVGEKQRVDARRSPTRIEIRERESMRRGERRRALGGRDIVEHEWGAGQTAYFTGCARAT
jgi:hypothetical protein